MSLVGSALAMAVAVHPETPQQSGRLVWTVEEDALILRSEVILRRPGPEALAERIRISALLPNRSAEAVRNRFLRLQAALTTLESGPVVAETARRGPKYKCSRCGVPKRNHVCTVTKVAIGKVRQSYKGGERAKMWTTHEDETIMRSVATHGPKWAMISDLMPGRTANAIRNRYHRLDCASAEVPEVLSTMAYEVERVIGGAAEVTMEVAEATMVRGAQSTPAVAAAVAAAAFAAAEATIPLSPMPSSGDLAPVTPMPFGGMPRASAGVVELSRVAVSAVTFVTERT